MASASTPSTSLDRRADPRVAEIRLVQVSRFDEEGFRADLAAGRTLDLSRGGLRLELHHPLPLRSQVRIDLAAGDDLVTVEGSVVYLRAVGGDRCEIGIEFGRLDAQTQQVVDSMIES